MSFENTYAFILASKSFQTLITIAVRLNLELV